MRELVTVEVAGIKSLIKNLDSYGVAIKVQGGQKAVAAAAQLFKREARKKVPVKSGQLQKSIIARKISKKGAGLIEYIVTLSRGRKAKFDGWYGHFVEFGTSPHVIKVNQKKVMGRDGRFGTMVSHPGSPAKPFMRPAFNENHAKALLVMRVKLAKFIEAKGRTMHL